MLRFFTMGRRLDALTRPQFHAGLLTGHAPLVQACPGFRAHCLHYRQNHVGGAVDLAAAALDDQDARFDNCSEFWFADVDALLASFNNDDYFRMLRPDENRWSNADSRIAFLGREHEVWQAGPALPTAVPATKVLVLSQAEPGAALAAPAALGLGLGLLADYPGFFALCERYVENDITGQMDFKNARVAEHNTLPYTNLSELWFEGVEQARAAFASEDGQRLLASQAVPFARPQGRVALWATERVIL